MPTVGRDVMSVMNLYSRCQSSRSLPYAGGVLDQPAALMELFDVIEATREAHRRRQEEAERTQKDIDRLKHG